MIENGPIPAIHGVVRWRLIDLCQWVFEETMSRELHAMDYRKLFARPRHYAHAIMPKQIPTLDACSKLPRDAQ